MNIDMILRIAAIGILVSVVSQVLKQAGREDIATLATLTGLVIVLLMVVNLISEFFGSVQSIFNLY